MVILLIWSALLLLLLFATLISGVLALCLRDRARRVCTDLFLGLATTVVLMGYAASWLPQDALMKTEYARQAAGANLTRKADLLAYGLAESTYSELLDEPWRFMVRLDGVVPLEKALERSEKLLREHVDKLPTNEALTARLAIVVHRRGGDAAEVIQKYRERGGKPTPLLNILRRRYAKNQPSGMSLSEPDIAFIKAGLPDNWYQREALQPLQKSEPLHPTGKSEDRNERFELWQKQQIAFQIVRALLCLCGIATLVALVKEGVKTQLPEIESFSFRRVYGCHLSLFCSQATLSFLTGIGIGIVMAISMASGGPSMISVSDSSLLIQAIAIIGSAAIVSLTTYLLICKQAGTGLLGFFVGNRAMRGWEFLRISFSWYCLFLLAGTLVSWFMAALPITAQSGKEVDFQIIDAVVTANGWLVAWYVLVVCLFAPLTEELLMRGLLYPWMRNRWGILTGILGSAAVFSAVHADFIAFLHYFSAGAILALAYEKTRSLPITATVHCMWNGTFMLLAAMVPR